MKTPPLVAAALLLSACATGYDPSEIEAVRDYIAAGELEPVDEIRLYSQMSYTYLNDRFVVIPTRRQDYLVEFIRNCRELRETQFTSQMVDQRRNINTLRARTDTIRGCRIDAFYAISDEQVKELKNLGDAPGEEIFLSDDDK